MKSKMAKITYLSKIDSKKQTKQTRRTETESWIRRAFCGCQIGGGFGRMGRNKRGLRSRNR